MKSKHVPQSQLRADGRREARLGAFRSSERTVSFIVPSFPRKRESKRRFTMTRQPAVYILASKPNGTLYVGVTSDLPRRIWDHKQDVIAGFTRKYRVHDLVYFEQHEEMIQANKLPRRKRTGY